MFDEPTSALDPELAFEVLDTIRNLANEGLTMVIVTHQIRFISKLADRIIFIDDGVIGEGGSPDVILKNN